MPADSCRSAAPENRKNAAPHLTRQFNSWRDHQKMRPLPCPFAARPTHRRSLGPLIWNVRKWLCYHPSHPLSKHYILLKTRIIGQGGRHKCIGPLIRPTKVLTEREALGRGRALTKMRSLDPDPRVTTSVYRKSGSSLNNDSIRTRHFETPIRMRHSGLVRGHRPPNEL